MSFQVLTVDVGNTATVAGLFKGPLSSPYSSPQKRWTLSSRLLRNPKLLQRWLKRIHLQINENLPLGIVFSSVVPEVTGNLKKCLDLVFRIRPLEINGKSRLQVQIKYSRPERLGSDRVANARGAMALGKGPSIVIDIGTAATFDCVSARGEFMGGAIVPGPRLWAESLFQKTSKLPMFPFSVPSHVIGRETRQGLMSGLYFGYRGLIGELLIRMKKELGRGTRVYGTGGQARWLLNGHPGVDAYLPDLTLVGLYWAWQDLQTEVKNKKHR